MNHMKVTSPFKFVYFILVAILALQSCSPKSSDTATTSASPHPWLVNMNDAQAQSVKDKKPILVYFTSSDTCGLCEQLETDIFSTPMFKEWAEKKVVLFKVDFSTLDQLPPGSQEQNTAMARSLKVSTYPTFWMLSVTHEVENGRFKIKPIGKNLI